MGRVCYGTSLLEARVVIGDFKDDHNHRHTHLLRSWQRGRARVLAPFVAVDLERCGRSQLGAEGRLIYRVQCDLVK